MKTNNKKRSINEAQERTSALQLVKHQYATLGEGNDYENDDLESWVKQQMDWCQLRKRPIKRRKVAFCVYTETLCNVVRVVLVRQDRARV
jgi:hypothetical protein